MIPREVLNHNLDTPNCHKSLTAWFFRSSQGEFRYDLLLFALVYVSLVWFRRAEHGQNTHTSPKRRRAKSLLHKEKFGWETWTRTRIARFRVWSPTNWTISQPWEAKKKPQQDPEARDGHDSSNLI